MKKRLIILTFIMAFLLAGCAASHNESVMEAKKMDTTDQLEYESEEMAEDGGTSNDIRKTGASDYDIEKNRKIIKTGYITIETLEFEKSAAKLSDIVNINKGYIFSSNNYDGRENDDYDNKHLECVIKIPAENFDFFMNSSGNIGDLIDKSEQKEDVTSAYMDVEARLKTLKIQEDRLISILEKSDNLENILELENELADVRYQIESFEANKRNLDNSISYSTIHISIHEIKIKKEFKDKPIGLGEKIQYAFSDSLSITRVFLEEMIIFLVYALPLIIIVLILFFVLRAIIRAIKSKKVSKQKKEAKNKEISKVKAEELVKIEDENKK